MEFTSHDNSMIGKWEPDFHAICRLIKAGVNNKCLAYIYRSQIIIFLSYAAPCWVLHLSTAGHGKIRMPLFATDIQYAELKHTEDRLAASRPDV